MGAEVRLDELAKAIEDYDLAYLVTVGENSAPHVVAVTPLPDAGALHIAAPGRHTHRNIAAHPTATLVWAPRDPSDYSLIVDGACTVDGDLLTVHPTRAILHRAAAPEHVPDEGACASDCRHIPL
ncbi:putative FMN-binding protein [Nocardia nova SH22a]|uniref:Putative FMN-binding protein n=1 Tax=Nocardia nova SH22a TaxID=1415166 RepID=W5TM97_9NOCA|nr:pyridoxamine 5'-phosphate oxidase family protein [Nocardia nova]AHH20475.1 putative FMN-binding protein [Nocardia nova SH22a]